MPRQADELIGLEELPARRTDLRDPAPDAWKMSIVIGSGDVRIFELFRVALSSPTRRNSSLFTVLNIEVPIMVSFTDLSAAMIVRL
jgi:hypothetical protein